MRIEPNKKKMTTEVFIGGLISICVGIIIIGFSYSRLETQQFLSVINPAPIIVKNSDQNVGISFGDTLPSKTSAQLDAIFNDLNSLGITWIRFDMAWDDIQPKNSTTYDWTDMDRIMVAANAHHLKMLPDVAYTPVWARSSMCPDDDKCEPANNAAFATFVQVAAKRYTPKGIIDWEIWNEPNIEKFWLPAPDPHKYTDLLKLSYNAIKSQNRTAIVISAGLAPAQTKGTRIAPIEFLQDMYKDGAQPYFDAVGDHPYSFPTLPSKYELWSGWDQMSETPSSIRSVMVDNGDASKEIWMTEFGAPTGGPESVSETIQSESITQAIITNQQYVWAGPLFIYSYKDLGVSSDTNENFFGIIRADGTDKPSYFAIKKLLTGTN